MPNGCFYEARKFNMNEHVIKFNSIKKGGKQNVHVIQR